MFTRVALIVAVVAWIASAAGAQTNATAAEASSTGRHKVEVELTLLNQTRFAGKVVAYNEHAVVVFDGRAPYAFAWDELDAVSACQTRRALLQSSRSDGALTAEDHLALGAYALRRGQEVLAAREFRQAKGLEPRVRAVIDEHKKAVAARPRPFTTPTSSPTNATATDASLSLGVSSLLDELPTPDMPDRRIIPTPPEWVHRIVEVLRDFYAPRLAEVFQDRVTLVETDHFLIWTDLPSGWRKSLSDAVEGMYAALCEQFGYDVRQNIFLGKCPIFCFASREDFLRFARAFDGYEQSDLAGYTRSIPQRGYVHVALFLPGRTPEHWDRFLCTLVHESSHAFLHRFHASGLIPHWINEGYAELTTERILKDRCFTGETSSLLAEQFVRHDWPVHNLLRGTGPILVHQYPVAHSIVAFLERTDAVAFRRFIMMLKQGESTEDALRAAYDWSLDELESKWRADVRARWGP